MDFLFPRPKCSGSESLARQVSRLSAASMSLKAGTVFRYQGNAATWAPRTDFRYDDDGLLIQAGALSLTRHAQTGLVTGTSLNTITDNRGYNSFGEIISYDSGVLFSVRYTRDSLGRISSKRETIGGSTSTYAYSYDESGRLFQVTKDGRIESYTYDPNGNRLSHTDADGRTTTGSYDAQDRLTQYGTTTFSYTANGELASRTDAAGTTVYNYDVTGNLLSATLPNQTLIQYIIDGLNRRVGKKVNGVLAQRFLYQDPLRPVAELDGAGNVVSLFVYSDPIGAPAYMTRGGRQYRILSDYLGSPRLVIDSVTGEVVQRIDYDAFGNVLQDSNPGFQPFGFAGGLYDRHTKLLRFGARDYDPETGRWTAKDPILFDGGDTNLYAYAGNDPVNRVDPPGFKGSAHDTLVEQSSPHCYKSLQLPVWWRRPPPT
jgi:RHS repeat-associated protein